MPCPAHTAAALLCALVLALLVATLPPGHHPGVTGAATATTSAGATGAAGAVGAAGAMGAPARRSRRPNIVVVMADDMRFDDMRFAPRLRRLARRGVTFENSFANFPLCCPNRASFLTGQLPHNHDVYWHEPPQGYGAFDDSRTLATSLRSAGYRTGFVGKYLNRYGLDDSLVSGTPSYRYVPRGWTDWYAAIENPGLPGIRGGTYHYFSTAFNINGSTRNHPGRYQTGVIGRYTRRLAETYGRRRAPFFLYVNYVAPHNGGPREADDPRRVRDRRGRRYEVTTPARPGWVEGRFDRVVRRPAGVPRWGGATERDVSDKPAHLRDNLELSRSQRRAVKELTRQRAEAVFVMDREIGRTVRTLKRIGEWDETVLVFTSDNGYFLGEHRIPLGKVHGHEPSLRVPLLVTGPGLRDGSRRFDPVSTVDLTATLLALGRASPPQAADGTSLVPVLRQGDRGWGRAVAIESSVNRRTSSSVFGPRDLRFSVGVRTSGYTYIRYSSGAQEMYDLAKDPHQLRSVARVHSYRRDRRALRSVAQELEDCRGASCRVALPPRLRATAAENERSSRQWLAAHRRRYGWQ